MIEDTDIADVKIITPRRFGDARGYFCETWSRAALDVDFVQDNESLSAPTGTLRGLHFQAPPRGQDKLVRVVAGAVLDVAVDIRRGSPSYGKWISVELSAENGRQMLIPKGFAHGFVTLMPDTIFVYKCSDTYAPDTEGAVHFADPDLGIDWGIAPADAIVSDKDGTAPSFADLDTPFDYGDRV